MSCFKYRIHSEIIFILRLKNRLHKLISKCTFICHNLWVLGIFCEHISHTHIDTLIFIICLCLFIFLSLSAFTNLPQLQFCFILFTSSLYNLFYMILPTFCYVKIYMSIIYIMYIHKYMCVYNILEYRRIVIEIPIQKSLKSSLLLQYYI